ncbi:MAG: hypothetical protein KDC80_29290 [Saprospiraceae bacterium]|nr:hypothetical protein [Saprospiraceae bacterium]
MKKIALFSLTTALLLWIGCRQQADVISLLKDTEAKDKVFTAILDDHELMIEFMTKMMSNEHALMMMKGNRDIMGKMMGDGNVMHMMKDSPDMMHNMMNAMMKDGQMMGHMMQMMNQQGMMSNECMQSCTKMMADKGMSMEMGMMVDKGDGSGKEGGDHDAHH